MQSRLEYVIKVVKEAIKKPEKEYNKVLDKVRSEVRYNTAKEIFKEFGKGFVSSQGEDGYIDFRFKFSYYSKLKAGFLVGQKETKNVKLD